MTASLPFDRRAYPADLRFSSWTAADGWRHRRFDRAAAVPRGSVLFMTGRGDFAEKYLETLDHLVRAGWNVTGFDWRGQGGSGRILAGQDIGHIGSLDPLVDDLATFAADWRATTPGPHVAIGHSMGGHLILRTLGEGRLAVDGTVLVAPMLGLATPRIGRLAAFLAGLFGMTMRPVWRGADMGARQRRLTGSAERFADMGWWGTTDPVLTDLVPSWGWLHAAYDSIARLRRTRLDRVAGPVLMLGTKRDRLVAWRAIRDAAARLPDAEVAWIDGAHELLREADDARIAAHDRIDRFLDRIAPRPAAS